MYSGNLRVTLHNLHAGSWLKQLLPRLLLELFFFGPKYVTLKAWFNRCCPLAQACLEGHCYDRMV